MSMIQECDGLQIVYLVHHMVDGRVHDVPNGQLERIFIKSYACQYENIESQNPKYVLFSLQNC